MTEITLGYIGQLVFRKVQKADVEKIKSHVREHVGITGRDQYFPKSKVLYLSVASTVHVPFSVLGIQREDLKRLAKETGADDFELGIVD